MSIDLKQSRIDRKLSLEKVAEDLKIRKQYISALEENKQELIPGNVYVNGYLRMYKEYLGLESVKDQKITDVRAKTPQRNETSEISLPHNTNSMLIAAIILALFSWYFVYHKSYNQSQIIELLENIDHKDYLIDEKNTKVQS
jgi:cytoskeletal protein RodZ